MDKTKILSTAQKNFFAKRYDDVKLDVIAAELGIQKPSLYYYFSDKKELFVQTLKFSMQKYMQDFDEIIKSKNISEIIKRYLTYPVQNKNLFGIAYQKDYCIDDDIRYMIATGKQSIMIKLEKIFEGVNNVKSYLVINLLEKIAQNNCIEGNCLKYDIKEIVKEISEMIK